MDKCYFRSRLGALGRTVGEFFWFRLPWANSKNRKKKKSANLSFAPFFLSLSLETKNMLRSKLLILQCATRANTVNGFSCYKQKRTR